MICAMRKAVLSILFRVAPLAVAIIAEAQQPKKVFRIGHLSNTDAASEFADAETIRAALGDLGYIEGQNIPVSTDMGRGSAIGLLSLRPNWCVSLSAAIISRNRPQHAPPKTEESNPSARAATGRTSFISCTLPTA